jgi:glycosyltransferase
MERPLLSLVIPTKDRYYYLKYLIMLVDSFDFDDFEMVIQDNTCDNFEILKFLEEYQYAFVKYYHTKEQLSVKENSDLAILHSSGEYVCFIGDDDGITRYILDCVKWMKRNRVDALRQKNPIFYYWPDHVNNLYNLKGSLSFKAFTKSLELVDAKCSYKQLAKKGFSDLYGVPRVYNGIVKRTTLDKIYQIGGTFYPGPSPDMANAVALCFFVEKFVIIDFPIIIAGACKMAAGGARLLKNEVGRIEDQPFLPSNIREVWDKNLPYVWASEVIWPESAIEALEYVGHLDLKSKINYEYILARFAIYHLAFISQSFVCARKKMSFLFWFLIILLEVGFSYLKRYLLYKLLGRLEDNVVYNNVTNICDAHQLLMDKIEDYVDEYPKGDI